MIICPGNEAGDATSCASADLGDRGWGARYADTTDNISRIFIHQDGTSGFSVTISDSDDNVTAQQAVTHSKGATPSLGTASGSVTQTTYSAISDSVVHSGKTYFLSKTDNGTLYEDGTAKQTNVFGAVVAQQIILSSDGTYLVGIADNSTNVGVFNLTGLTSSSRIGANVARDTTTDQFCGVVGNGRVIVAQDDNVTLDNTSSIILSSTSVDNDTDWEYTSTITANLDNDTKVNCAMTYAGSSGDNNTFYLVIDNITNTHNNETLVYSIVDNGTTLTPTLTGTINSTTPDSLAITASGSVPYIAVDNSSGGVSVYKTTSLTHLLPTTGSTVQGASNAPVDIAVSCDNKTIGVVGVGSVTNPAIRIFYDE